MENIIGIVWIIIAFVSLLDTDGKCWLWIKWLMLSTVTTIRSALDKNYRNKKIKQKWQDYVDKTFGLACKH